MGHVLKVLKLDTSRCKCLCYMLDVLHNLRRPDKAALSTSTTSMHELTKTQNQNVIVREDMASICSQRGLPATPPFIEFKGCFTEHVDNRPHTPGNGAYKPALPQNAAWVSLS